MDAAMSIDFTCPAKVVSCEGKHANGKWSHEVVAYDSKVLCSLRQEEGEPPLIHGYFDRPLPPGTLCNHCVGNDGFPFLELIDSKKERGMDAAMRAEVDGMITDRILALLAGMIEKGQIPDIPEEGPSAIPPDIASAE